MKKLPSGEMNANEQAFWMKVIYSDTTWVSVMGVAVVVSLVVTFF